MKEAYINALEDIDRNISIDFLGTVLPEIIEHDVYRAAHFSKLRTNPHILRTCKQISMRRQACFTGIIIWPQNGATVSPWTSIYRLRILTLIGLIVGPTSCKEHNGPNSPLNL